MPTASDIAIRVEGLGKQFQTGETIRYGALRDVLTGFLSGRFRARPQSAPFWALRDVSFEVKRGEVLGLIGHNGAGKSTLLKILTRITKPTEGRAILNGRVGSLLEVGTGFHPELTGRENIFLNGSILGLRHAEIRRKFDEIVDFAGVEQFIDTPVKRYSSGMQMRLAFSVAAHLEPEILLVDEVLAVGDAAFRKKSMGKMGEVARGGRTIIFVSHNLAAVTNLCQRAVLLERGRVLQTGPTEAVVRDYLATVDKTSEQPLSARTDRKGSGRLRVTSVVMRNDDGEPVPALRSGDAGVLEIHYTTPDNIPPGQLRATIVIDMTWGQRLCMLDSNFAVESLDNAPAHGKIVCRLPRLNLAAGVYDFTVYVEADRTVADWVQGAGKIHVEAGDYYGSGRYPGIQDGPMLIDQQWSVE